MEMILNCIFFWDTNCIASYIISAWVKQNNDYNESRLSIYTNGLLDQVTYLNPNETSQTAIIPGIFFIGGYKESFNEPLMILDGAVSDVMIFTQHIHDNIALVLSNQASTNNVTRLPRAIPLLLPLFILTVWDVVRVGVEELRLLLLLLTGR
ncbi:hypothetical protein RhiirC2_781406 [Rhizophagus irregularis]|uniref:Uncharacterized protein n=1 Tax=Rhizophagus irregularis TaxID=588596 RepID=A0A2N1N5J7_9GLOM|nr:hypothetical protein RhiirC2_781406 [Rhizophagus irregularis]